MTAYRFGEFELDTDESRLLRRGHAVSVQPKVFDAIVFLLTRPGRLVTQEELLDALWPDVVVGMEALTQLVRKVRRALGDRPATPRYIETVVKRGYRFIAEVESAAAAPAPSPARRDDPPYPPLRPEPTLAIPAWMESAPLPADPLPAPRSQEGTSGRVDDVEHLRELLLAGARIVIGNRFALGQRARAVRGGTVYRAEDIETGRAVAIEVLHRADARDVVRFQREVRILSGLTHPGIVRYVAHGTTDTGLCFLATEWLSGVDLADFVASAGPADLSSFRALGLALSDAMAFAHEAGVVHRDLRPGNVLLVDGTPARGTILGFGLARWTEDVRVTETGAMLGRLGFVAPEQAEGRPDVDARADVFSMGCLFFLLLAGRPLYTGTYGAILRRLVLDEATPIGLFRNDLPTALEELLADMLQRDRELRPRNARDVAQRLSHV